MRKDKEKVLDEVWNEDRVKSFRTVKSYDEVAEDFHMLLKAYQSMRTSDFAIFMTFCTGEGRDPNSPNPLGQTVLDIVLEHRNSGEYADILRANGARPSSDETA